MLEILSMDTCIYQKHVTLTMDAFTASHDSSCEKIHVRLSTGGTVNGTGSKTDQKKVLHVLHTTIISN